MTKYIFIIIVLSFNFSYAFQSNPANDNDVAQIIQLTYNLKFDSALTLVDIELQSYPSSLQWKFFHAMILFRESIYYSFQKSVGFIKNENEIIPLEDSSITELKEIIEIGKKIIKKNPGDTTALFYTGAAYGYIGINYVRNGSYFAGASEGNKGLNYHDKLMKICPNWADVYLSEGVFNYFASGLPWYLKPVLWMLGKSGSESKARKYLKIAGEKGQYAKYEALEFLVKLFIRENKPDSAAVIINKLIKDLPGSKYYFFFRFGVRMLNNHMLYESNKLIMKGIDLSRQDTLSTMDTLEVGYMYVYLAQSFFKAGNYNRVIELWKDLIQRKLLPNEEQEGYIMLANSYMELGDKAKAKKYYEWVFHKSTNPNLIKIAREKLEELSGD